MTTGTFLRGLIHVGDEKSAGGRAGEAPALSLSGSLARLGFPLARLKTGTPCLCFAKKRGRQGCGPVLPVVGRPGESEGRIGA